MVARLTFSLFMLGVVACMGPTAPPQTIGVILTSGVATRPYTAEELAIPALRESIRLCQRRGRKNCDVKRSAVEDLREFNRAAHSELIALVQLSGLQENRSYEVELKLYNPDSDLARRVAFSQSTSTAWHPSYALDYWFNWKASKPAWWWLGRWRIEVLVNGRLEAERSFHVVEVE